MRSPADGNRRPVDVDHHVTRRQPVGDYAAAAGVGVTVDTTPEVNGVPLESPDADVGERLMLTPAVRAATT